MPFAAGRPSSGAVIPSKRKRNPDADGDGDGDGEDVSCAVVMRGRGPKDPVTSTSSRAIILRHGRHGFWGDGTLATFKKLSGQEKLALRAGTLRLRLFYPAFV
jgi:hypothetical protein